MQTSIILLSIIAWNILSCYFWIWFYKELFHKNASIKTIIFQWLVSALGSLSLIRLSWIQNILSKVLVEESAKTLTSEWINTHTIHSDHIATAILAGIGFAVIENLIYIYYVFDNNLIQISIIRALTNSILHALFTWLIWFGIFQFFKSQGINKYIQIIVYSSLGIRLHFLYNRSMNQSSIAFGFVFVIIWYFLLSYLLYRSDRLYLQ